MEPQSRSAGANARTEGSLRPHAACLNHPMPPPEAAPLTARWDGVEPLELSGFLPAWDVERRRFEAGPLVDWLLTVLREQGVRAERLERLHDHIDAAQALALAERITLATAHARP